MKELLLNLLTLFKEVNSWLIFQSKNKSVITIISLIFSLVIWGVIKFDDIKQTFQPSDLVKAREYLDRYIVLALTNKETI